MAEAKSSGPGAEVTTQPRAVAEPKTGLQRLLAQYGVSYAFLLPYMIFFFAFLIIPVGVAIWLSFTYFNMLEPPRVIGWSNYRLLFLEDDIFVLSIRNTLFFAFITGPVSLTASFLLAWFINQIRVRTIYALAFYAPSLTSAIAMAVVWRIVFSGDRYGYMNYFLMRMGFIQEPFLWLIDQRTMLPVVMFVMLWMSMGNNFLVFLAGLQTVNTELYEAGKVDGIAHPLQEMWYITLPSMKPQMLFGVINAVVLMFSAGFEISLSLAGLPSPLYAAHMILSHLYDYAFIRFEMGYAAAIAVILFIITFGIGQGALRLLSTKDE
ncbi:MAG: sugar ABC transporter permease [Chloroflexota bacterium]|nr:sugar ABC transporter permease [Chloroflexota bacterium]